MGQASTIGLDIAKWVFQAHGADATGRVVFRKRLVRAKVLEFFAGQPPCLVALEACGGAHYWARELGKLGHTVRLIPPAYVKPVSGASAPSRSALDGSGCFGGPGARQQCAETTGGGAPPILMSGRRQLGWPVW